MSDRTMLAVGGKSFSVPKLTKRLVEIAAAVGLTSFTVLVVLMLNNVLTGKGGWQRGYDTWLKFIGRSDILGTMILTAVVTVAFVYWYRSRSRR